jgi:phosphatidylglycerophosphate synthase
MKFFFTKSAKINFLTLLISYVVYPLSFVLAKVKIKPNLITFVSILFAIYSSYQFILGNFKFFAIFWILSILLDLCDGQVARISKLVNKTAFNFDSLSDLFKIYLLVFSSAIYYDDRVYWMVISTFIFIYLFHEVLFVNLVNLSKIKKNTLYKNLSNKNKFLEEIFVRVVHFFFKIDVHALFFFLILGLSLKLAFLIIIYMQIVLLLNIFRISYLLTKLKT